MKKFILILTILLLATTFIHSSELGFVIGNMNRKTGLTLGLSVGMGMLLPMLKVEYELMKNPDLGNKSITTGIKLKPKFGNFSPYCLVGIGTDFEKFSLQFSSYDTFSFYGAGIYLYFGKIFSIRFDLRFFDYKYVNKTRLTGGIFINI